MVALIPKVTSLSTTLAAPTVIIPVGKPTVLTVGAGMEFATLGDALKASAAGDTIAVEAGTYTNDFGTVSAAVSIVAVGGIVHEVATQPPTDDKGILTVNANLTIEGFTFTGGSDGSPDGNVSGIRLQSGNLNVSYCEFSHMQEGLLADPDPSGTVTIDHSFFLDNGTGDGLSHNLYVGAVKSLLVTNSLFEGAVVGHEIKSRAATTTIENNTIIDGPTGTGSYDIDIPNGGVAVVQNNIIEKGPDASNDFAIHYGGETQYAYAQNSLDVSGNTIINDLPDSVQSFVVLNQVSVTGGNATTQIHGNTLYNYAAASVASGAANIYGNTLLNGDPEYSTQSPLLSLPAVALGNGTQTLHLTTNGHTVTGGAFLLIVSDSAGSNSISGGIGGMQLCASAGWDQITTEAGAADTVNLPGRSSVLVSHGTDHINASGAYELIEATGHATIAGTGFSTYDLNGAGEVLNASSSGFLNVGEAGNASVTDTDGDLTLSVAAGGRLAITDSADTAHGGAVAQATVSGALTGQIANVGTLSLTTGGTGALVQAGSGPVSVTGGTGNDTLMAGSGQDYFALGGGQDSVVFGGGSAAVTVGAGQDSLVFNKGMGGSDTINGYLLGTDSLVFRGFAGAPISAGVVVNGSTQLTLSDGTHIDFVGVALLGYPSGGGQTTIQGGGGGGGGGTPTPAPASGGTLTTGGHSVTGGSTLLTITDAAGGNTIAGGAGGLAAVVASGDLLSTAAGSANLLTLACYDTVAGAGTDQVIATGYRNSLGESGSATLALLGTVNTVQGGAGRLVISDSVGGNSIAGGAGGLVATLSGAYDQVTTASGAADTVSLGDCSTLLSQGTDHITLAGGADLVTVAGAASVTTGTVYATLVLDGADSVTTAGEFSATVGATAQVAFASSGVGGSIDKLAGGSLMLSQSSGGGAAVTIGGGAASVSASGTGLVVTAGSGCTVSAGDGNVTLNGGGTDVFTGGSGQAVLNLGSGGDTVTLGNGGATISAGAQDLFVVPVGCSGTAVISNWSAQDSIAGSAAGGAPIVSESVSGGSCLLSFAGGAQIELVGVSHFP